MGVQSATDAVAAWCQGQAVEARMATVLTGLLLSKTVELRGSVEACALGALDRGASPIADVSRETVRMTTLDSPWPGSRYPHRRPSFDLAANAKPDPGPSTESTWSSYATGYRWWPIATWLSVGSGWSTPVRGAFCISGPKRTIGTDGPRPREWKEGISSAEATVIKLHDDVDARPG